MKTNNNNQPNELAHAGQCLSIYLNNTIEIYAAYTVPAIKNAVNAKRVNENGPARLDDETAWGNLNFWVSWQPEVKNALQAAAHLVRKYDHLTPTAADIEAVKANYVAYIIECAQYELQNA